jgi:hypothetical protein
MLRLRKQNAALHINVAAGAARRLRLIRPSVNPLVTADPSNCNDLVTGQGGLWIVATQSQQRPIRAKLGRSLVSALVKLGRWRAD